MLSEEKLKAIEMLVTGHTQNEASVEAGVTTATLRNWMKDIEFWENLVQATEQYSKSVLSERTRSYRVMMKKIQDKIMQKIEANALDTLDISTLVKLLDKTVLSMRNDESTAKTLVGSATQNNLQININTEQKLAGEQFAKKFSDLLGDFDHRDIENIAQAVEKDSNSKK